MSSLTLWPFTCSNLYSYKRMFFIFEVIFIQKFSFSTAKKWHWYCNTTVVWLLFFKGYWGYWQQWHPTEYAFFFEISLVFFFYFPWKIIIFMCFFSHLSETDAFDDSKLSIFLICLFSCSHKIFGSFLRNYSHLLKPINRRLFVFQKISVISGGVTSNDNRSYSYVFSILFFIFIWLLRLTG